jgi:phage FluMu protein Com
MAIEFRCSQCNQLLRVPDDSVGRSARCPKCQSLMQVPAASDTPIGAAPTTIQPPIPPASGRPPASSFGASPPAKPTGESPFGGPSQSPSANPFAGNVLPPKPPGNPFGDGGTSAAASLNPYAAPAGGYAYQSTPYSASGGPITNVVVPLEAIMGHAWRVWQVNLGLLVGTTVIVLAITYAIALPLGFVQGALEEDAPEAAAAVAIFGNLLSNLVQMFLGIGQVIISLKIARGLPANVGDLFSGGSRFLPVLGGSLLAGIALFFGLMLCIVPGIFLLIWFWPFYYLIVDEKASVTESFGLASTVTEGNRLTTVVIWLVSVGIMIIGFLALCIGVVFAAPLVSLLWATSYLMMSGQLPTQPQYARY